MVMIGVARPVYFTFHVMRPWVPSPPCKLFNSTDLEENSNSGFILASNKILKGKCMKPYNLPQPPPPSRTLKCLPTTNPPTPPLSCLPTISNLKTLAYKMATWGSSVSKASDLVPYFGFKFRFLIHILNVSSTVVEREQEVWSSTLPPLPLHPYKLKKITPSVY